MKISLGLHMDEKNQHLPAGKHRTNGDKASREKKRKKNKKRNAMIIKQEQKKRIKEYKWEGDSMILTDVVTYIKKSLDY